MSLHAELAIVGGGPAGIAAAVTADQAGVDVVLVDAGSRPGGQYFKQEPAFRRAQGAAQLLIGRQALSKRRKAQTAALQALASSRARVLSDTLVWGAFPAEGGAGWELALYGPEAPRRLVARTLILATGAYDRPIPFPGWTLPGVMTAGGIQAFLKGQGVLPGRRFLLSGTGPLQIAVAAGLIEAGAEVVAVLEGARLGWRAARHAAALWGQWDRLAEAWDYGRTLRAARVPMRLGWAVVAAHGKDQVEEAVICRVDDAWRPIRGSAQTVAVDAIGIGFGLMPSTELARLLGCAHDFEPGRGGYVPRRDALMQTSMPGVYAVGDGAGIGGAAMAQVEGRIAALAAAQRLGKLSERAAQAAILREQAGLARERRFAALLGALFTPGPGLYSLADDDTLICRCEEVTLGEIRGAIREGAADASAVKGLTRAGMGNCQGRICGELVARIIAAETAGNPCDLAAIRAAGAFTARPPIHPLPLEVLA